MRRASVAREHLALVGEVDRRQYVAGWLCCSARVRIAARGELNREKLDTVCCASSGSRKR